jgi:hypothetical protein
MLHFLTNTLKFNPDNGDWSGALVAILFGSLSLIISLTSGIIIYLRWKKESQANRKEQERLSNAEYEQTYITLRRRYDELWDKLTYKGQRHLYCNYSDNKSLKEFLTPVEISIAKTTVWQLISHLSDIEFLYCTKQDSLYWKRWVAICKFVFDKPFIRYSYVKNRNQFMYNSSFVEYVDTLISSNSDTIKLEDEKESNENT